MTHALLIVVLFFTFQVFLSRSVLIDENRSKTIIKLLTGIHMAMQMVKPNLTEEERNATRIISRYLNTTDSYDYIDAIQREIHPNFVRNLLWFLNALVYNGDPQQSVWRESEILVRMINTKLKNKLDEESQTKVLVIQEEKAADSRNHGSGRSNHLNYAPFGLILITKLLPT